MPEGRTVIAPPHNLRVDLQLIADMVASKTRLLDVGCGDGALLAYLARAKQVDGRGMELSMDGVHTCVANGIAAIQGDADTDLKDYPDDAFDYVVLSQTLQATRRPHEVLRHLVRIGRSAFVSFPNFAYWRVRSRLLLTGRMPVTPTLPFSWFDTPNIHLCSIKDFLLLCDDLGIVIERGIALNDRGRPLDFQAEGWRANLLAQQALFRLRQR
ncbi:MAG: methionine biosynthesis protein MetW [Alphaproteobacteria bacterium]